MPTAHTGGCLCGAVRYEIAVPVSDLRACHCTHCQKASGAHGTVGAVVPSSSFKVIRGTPKHYEDKADSGRTLVRHFCGDCGSPVYSTRPAVPEILVVRAGTLDDSSAMKIVAHIWTKSAQPWSHIDASAKRYPGQPE